VPQPQLTNRPSSGVGPRIGDASGVTSTLPAQLRGASARANTGNSSSAAAMFASAPIISTPLRAWLTWTSTAVDITTQSRTGSGSLQTSASSACLRSGRFTPTMSANTAESAAAARATRGASMQPCVVSTPATHPRWIRIPVTSQPWTRSTPSSSAFRANAHAT